MDNNQQAPVPSADDEAASASSSDTEASKVRKPRGEPAAGGSHAIERIAAASRAMAETEHSDASSKARDKGGSRALIPALPPVAAAMAHRVRLPSHLPLYAAALFLVLGTGGLLGSQLGQTDEAANTAAVEPAKIERALPWKRDVAENGLRDSAKTRDEVRALRGELSALRANNEQLRQAEREKQAQETRALRVTLEAQKAEAASLKADLSARMERADREAVQRTDKTAERVERLERRLADPVVTGTIAPPKPAVAAEAPKPEKLPVPGIFLRDADRGVALLETKRGLLEVVPGDTIPGAGRVEAIERHGAKWRVVTSNGIIEGRLE